MQATAMRLRLQMVVTRLLPPHVLRGFCEPGSSQQAHDLTQDVPASLQAHERCVSEPSSSAPLSRTTSGGPEKFLDMGGLDGYNGYNGHGWSASSVRRREQKVATRSEGPFSESLSRVCLLMADVEGFTGLRAPP